MTPDEKKIKRQIKQIRDFIDTADEDQTRRIAKRVAWSVEQALRRQVERVRGWPDIIEDCIGTAQLIQGDMKSERKP